MAIVGAIVAAVAATAADTVAAAVTVAAAATVAATAAAAVVATVAAAELREWKWGHGNSQLLCWSSPQKVSCATDASCQQNRYSYG